MPETRYMEGYKDGKLVATEPYEVSDEELEEEARQEKIAELVAKTTRTNAQNTQLIDLLAARSGVTLPQAKNVKPVAVP